MYQLDIPSNVFWITAEEFFQKSINELKNKNVLLIMSLGNMKRLSLENWINNLSKETSFFWIDKISSNPTYVDVFNSLKLVKEFIPDIIIAIGGGSTIDMAKSIVGLFYLTGVPDLNEKDVLKAIQQREYTKRHPGISIFAIPTTSGTGSEITQWATIWDNKEHIKYSIDANYLRPERAYFIPEFTASMPVRLTLSTGFDALCQAIEAFWAKSTNIMIKEFSKASIRLIINFLPKVISNPNNLYYREKLLLGSLFSGLAFSNTRTTACHSISYPLTLKFGIEHGIACVLTLSKVMQINLLVLEDASELLDALGVKNTIELQTWLDNVSNDIVNLRLSAFGIEEEDIPGLVNLSFTVGRMDNNPVPLTHNDVQRILESILN